ASKDATKPAIGFQAERSRIRPHIAHPLPNIAGHVLASVGADTFREGSTSHLPLRANERRRASLSVSGSAASPSIDVRTIWAELISPRINPAIVTSGGFLPFSAGRQSP